MTDAETERHAIHAARQAAYAKLIEATGGDQAHANRLFAQLSGVARPGPEADADDADEYGPPELPRIWSRDLLFGEELDAWNGHVAARIAWTVCERLFDELANPAEFDDRKAVPFYDRVLQVAAIVDQLGALHHLRGTPAANDGEAWQATHASLHEWFPALGKLATRELAANLLADRVYSCEAPARKGDAA